MSSSDFILAAALCNGGGGSATLPHVDLYSNGQTYFSCTEEENEKLREAFTASPEVILVTIHGEKKPRTYLISREGNDTYEYGGCSVYRNTTATYALLYNTWGDMSGWDVLIVDLKLGGNTSGGGITVVNLRTIPNDSEDGAALSEEESAAVQAAFDSGEPFVVQFYMPVVEGATMRANTLFMKDLTIPQMPMATGICGEKVFILMKVGTGWIFAITDMSTMAE